MGMMGSMGEYRTMKIEGMMENVGVLILIDSGASHNFISPKVTTALGLKVTPMAAKSIKLGDGHRVNSHGMCEGINLQLGQIDVVVDAIVLELGGLDVVLGVAWLSTLGQVVMDWKSLTMQFLFKNQMVKLQGQGAMQDKQCFLNSFLEDKQRRGGLEWCGILGAVDVESKIVEEAN
ncbi:enzymatic polyprotein, partial [Trifolium medium]|nr:enzymatic polyprotein [Trifolium medium]